MGVTVFKRQHNCLLAQKVRLGDPAQAQEPAGDDRACFSWSVDWFQKYFFTPIISDAPSGLRPVSPMR
jgi:hypothetical protein